MLAIVVILVGGLVLVWRFLPPPEHKDLTPVATSTVPTSTVEVKPVTPDVIIPVTITTSTTSTVVDIPERRKGMLCDESDSICVPQSYKDQLIGNPLLVNGDAIAFEGTVSWKLIEGNGGKEVMNGFTTARQPDVGRPGPFEIRAFFPATYVPATSDATLMLFEESARDGSPIHVLRVPMKLSRQTTIVKIHSVTGDGKNCSDTRAITTNIPKTSLPVEASIRRLLELRPTQENPEQVTAIPQGTRLVSLKLTNGVLTLVFSRELENYGGGSCNVAAIRAQIEKTAKEFSAVRRVQISVEGKTPEETLQP